MSRLRGLLGSAVVALVAALVFAGIAASGVILMLITHALFGLATLVALIAATAYEYEKTGSKLRATVVGGLVLVLFGLSLFGLDIWLQYKKAEQDTPAMIALAKTLEPRILPPFWALQKTRHAGVLAPSVSIRGNSNVVNTAPITQTGKNNIAQLGNNNQATISEADKHLIQTISLVVDILTSTSGKPAISFGRSLGTGDRVALVKANSTSVLFLATDPASGQVGPAMNRILFHYEPEAAAEILGKPLEYLKDVSMMVADYSSFLSKPDLAPNSISRVHIEMRVNGILVLNQEFDVDAKALFSGQHDFDVSEQFNKVPVTYEAAVKP